MIRKFAILILFPFSIFAQTDFSSLVQDILVEVQYGTIKYSKVRPWIKELGKEYIQYGILIDSQFVLTQCDELMHATSIQVEYKKNKFLASINLMDKEINFCILKLNIPIKNYTLDWNQIQKSTDPIVKKNIKLYFLNEYNKIISKNFIVEKYLITSDYGFTKLPVFSVSSSTSFPVGSLAFDEKGLVGFLSYYDEKKLIFVPISRMNHFFKLLKNGNYSGFVIQGINLKPLNEELKKHYKIPEQNICYVNEVLTGSSGYNFLKEGDFVLEIDGIKPIEPCHYEDPLLGIQKMELLLTRDIRGNYRKEGDTITVKIVRDNQLSEIILPLKSYFHSNFKIERIPWKVYGQQPYIILQGFVFLELSHSYLIERLGNQWRSKALELAYIYDYQKYYRNENENDKIILLSEVLPDPVNIGYQDIYLKPVKTIQGKPIIDLKDFFNKIQEEKKKLKILTIELSDKKFIFIDLEKKEEHHRILKKFQIPKDFYINGLPESESLL